MVLCLPESPGNHSLGTDDRRIGDAALCPYPVEDGEGVPGVGVGEGQDPEQLAESGLPELKKPAVREEMEASQDFTQVHRGHQQRTSTFTVSCGPQFLHEPFSFLLHW